MCYINGKQTANNKQLSLKLTHILLFVGNLPDTFQNLDFSEWHDRMCLPKQFGCIFGLVWNDILWLKKIMFKTLIKKDSSLSKIEANMWNALLVEVPVSSNGSGSISIMPSCGCSSGCTIHLSFPADPRWLSLSWTGKWKQNPHILINDMAKSRF